MVTADVSDIHVVGPPPVLIADGVLPFEEETFSAALLLFMLAYPNDPAGVLAEAARVTRGPIIVVQSLHSGRLGYAWLRVREFFWTIVAFHVSKIIGYVARDAKFTMNTRRFYTAEELQRDVSAAGLRIRSRWERARATRRRPGGRRVDPGARGAKPLGETETRLSFVIPARNEEALIGEVLEAILASVVSSFGRLPARSLASGNLLRDHRGRRRERGRHCGDRGNVRR